MTHTFTLVPDWKLINALSEIDRFGGEWSVVEKREGKSLKELKSIATVLSVGASTRIEGSKMTDDEVKVLLDNLRSSRLEERDAQEVVGYFEALDAIAESYRDIEITENTIKGLHNILLRHSKKDEFHKGNYKTLSNEVEMTKEDGSKRKIFKPAAPGLETEEGMKKLIEWYSSDKETHPIVRSAVFVYDFLSIHPFQDGNGRLSRLLGTLLLLKHGYSWIQFVSFEHEIENRKSDYNNVLMQCQNQRPGENVYPWVIFFLSCLGNIQQKLMKKLESKGSASQMSTREKKVYAFLESHPGSRSGQIAAKLDIPLPSIKRILSEMVAQKLLRKHGDAAGTNYTIEELVSVKKNLFFKLDSKERKKEFSLMSPNQVIEIRKIILTPLFDWVRPGEWASRLMNQDLYFKISGLNNKGQSVQLPPVSISGLVSPMSYEPVFYLFNPINIPSELWPIVNSASQYPIKIKIELFSDVAEIDFDFDVIFVYDASLA